MKNYFKLFTVFALALLVTALPELAAAQTSDFAKKICAVYLCYLSSDLVLVIATLGIFFLGIGAFFGKVNWGLVIIVVIGIVVISGAMSLASAISSGNGSAGSCTKTGAGTAISC
jgi:type IV secretory pathway VirB2 component (pilin)